MRIFFLFLSIFDLCIVFIYWLSKFCFFFFCIFVCSVRLKVFFIYLFWMNKWLLGNFNVQPKHRCLFMWDNPEANLTQARMSTNTRNLLLDKLVGEYWPTRYVHRVLRRTVQLYCTGLIVSSWWGLHRCNHARGTECNKSIGWSACGCGVIIVTEYNGIIWTIGLCGKRQLWNPLTKV